MKRTTLLTLIARAGLMGLMCHTVAWAQEPACRPLLTERNQSILLEKSGQYCLQNDIWIDNAGIFVAHGRDRPYFAAEIVQDDIDLDLKEHVIRSGNSTNGVVIQNKSGSKSVPQRVTIKNGRIDSITWGISSGFSNMVIPSDLGDPLDAISKEGKSEKKLEEWRKHFQELDLSTLAKQNASRPATSAGYQKRDIHLENLHIFVRGLPKGTGAGGGAINIQGAGTLIRNCVIETDDGNAIWIYGPNAVIENNVIIVHGTNRLREADGAIRLIQADGTIIRNNKIVIKDNANHRGISTFDTGSITVENNTFYGMTPQDEIAKAFTGTLQMEERNSRFEPAWKAMFVAK